MERLFLVHVLFTMCWAVPQDLSGKMFTFPKESNSDHVRLMPTVENYSSVTVCLRYFTDVKRAFSIFSMATPTSPNDFLLFKKSNGDMDLNVRNVASTFTGLPGEQNMWMSLCGSWDSVTGLSQVWLNGKPSARKMGYSAGNVLNGKPIIILGQEQDAYGGNFDKGQAFIGHLSDVHMWNYVLSPCEIQRFTSDLNFTPGNVLNWRSLEYTIDGLVVLENKQTPCQQ
ncbi:serum amyloid P-component [Coregonus clupeaformis]|uniref:serum amyloid P-component n=1 Tax=Coregonus clupeaformis TaxID=59861 RepID=UPI001BDFA767|nr:serum amyloid P-component [Coregonus clupeaformis]